jgi:uncharacterized membrane protein (UPF0127 family)
LEFPVPPFRFSTRVLVGLSALALLASGATALAACPQDGQPVGKLEPLTVVTATGKHHFRVEVVDTDQSREKGLMCRKTMAPDRGMLFDFKKADQVAFWMKNTILPLDMLFIGADGRVVSIARNAVPFDETAIPSGGPALGVLEINAGVAEKDGVEPGDKVIARIFH